MSLWSKFKDWMWEHSIERKEAEARFGWVRDMPIGSSATIGFIYRSEIPPKGMK